MVVMILQFLNFKYHLQYNMNITNSQEIRFIKKLNQNLKILKYIEK
jgi:hypothetical protein